MPAMKLSPQNLLAMQLSPLSQQPPMRLPLHVMALQLPTLIRESLWRLSLRLAPSLMVLQRSRL